MLLKAKISAIYPENNTAELMLPEHNNAITAEIPFYMKSCTEYMVGQFVVLAVFGDDINDGVIL